MLSEQNTEEEREDQRFIKKNISCGEWKGISRLWERILRGKEGILIRTNILGKKIKILNNGNNGDWEKYQLEGNLIHPCGKIYNPVARFVSGTPVCPI